jgi:RND family efflux transporter MFP subunit
VSKRIKTALLCVAILAGSVLLSLLIRVLSAQREEISQTLEVTSSWELSEGRLLVKPLPAPESGERVNITAITRYPFDLAVVEVGGSGNPAAGPVPPVAVRTATLKPGPVQRSVVAFGTVEAWRDAAVPVHVNGQVIEEQLKLGKRFEAGDALLRIDDRDYALALRRAEADLARAVASAEDAHQREASLVEQVATSQNTLDARAGERDRWRKLAEENIASPERADQADTLWRAALASHQRLTSQLDTARAGLTGADAAKQQAEAARDMATLSLERCVVRAPFAGYVASRDVEVGEYVRAGQTVGRLLDQAKVRLRVHVREEEASVLEPGAAATVTLPGVDMHAPGNGEGYDADTGVLAVVDGVAAAADPRTRKVAVDVVVENPHGVLRPGLFARVKMEAGTIDDALLLPDDAVVADERGHHVFVAEGDVVERVEVELGWRQGEARLMRQGPEGEFEVVTGGAGLLFHGAPITRLGN